MSKGLDLTALTPLTPLTDSEIAMIVISVLGCFPEEERYVTTGEFLRIARLIELKHGILQVDDKVE